MGTWGDPLPGGAILETLRVYSFIVEVKNQDALSGIINGSDKITIVPDSKYKITELKRKIDGNPPLVIGTGPAGIFAGLIPALEKKGFTEEEIYLLLEVNPRNAFSIRSDRYIDFPS